VQVLDLAKQLSQLVCKELNKPEAVMQVLVKFDQSTIYGGTDDPNAVVELFSIGAVGPEVNASLSAALKPVLQEKLGVAPDRYHFIIFDKQASDWGNNGSTVAKNRG
jgi:phenylpyruvate tautomerase PptA (4-oxalocrotonate tautomerase family)